MEKLTTKKKFTLIKLYMSGLSYDQIAVKSRFSKGTISNVVSELKAGAFPEATDGAEQIETLRDLSLDLKNSGLSPGQCVVGLAILNRIKECGLDAADMESWPHILKIAGNEEEAKEFVKLVYHIQDFQNKTGLTLEKIESKIHDLEEKSGELQPILNKIEEQRHEIIELEKKRNDLAPVVNSLEQKYAMLNPIVKDLQNRQGDLVIQIKQEEIITASTQAALAAWNKEYIQLHKCGFNLESLLNFNEKCRAIAVKHDISLSSVRERLLQELKLLDKGLGLETLISTENTQLKKKQDAVDSAMNEIATLNTTIATLKGQKSALDGCIKAITLTVNEEIKKIVPHIKETIEQFTSELKRGAEDAVEVVRQVKDQALKVGQEIGRCQGIVESNQWVGDLVSLTRGDDNLEAKRARALLLLVMRGSQPWLKKHQAQLKQTTLKDSIDLIVLELERWQV